MTEPLNETTLGMTHYPTWKRRGDGITVSGRYSLILSKITNGMKELRSAMDQYYLPLTTFYSQPVGSPAAKEGVTIIPSISAVSSLAIDLPINIHLVTIQRTAANELLIRLAHQYAVNEDETFSQPVALDLREIFKAYNPMSVTEMTLSANEDKATQLKNKIQWNANADAKSKKANQMMKNPVKDDKNMVVLLYPMEIRTFTLVL